MSNELLKKVEESISNLMELKIVTAIGSINYSNSENNNLIPNIDSTKNTKVILTKISLLQGDISTIIDESLLSTEYQSIRDFHQRREEQGLEIIQKNLETVKKILKFLNEEVKDGFSNSK